MCVVALRRVSACSRKSCECHREFIGAWIGNEESLR